MKFPLTHSYIMLQLGTCRHGVTLPPVISYDLTTLLLHVSDVAHS